MSARKLTRTPFVLDGGQIGWLEGVTVRDAPSGGDDTTSKPQRRPLLHYFGGLPYGLPPVGALRFRQARPLPAYYQYGTRANPGRFAAAASVCPQSNGKGGPSEKAWGENCLQLNLYIPIETAESPRPTNGWPVFFYLHGGFLQWGAPNMRPEAIAPLLADTAFRAIIVAPAYRVNALGFLASRELQAEAQHFGEPVGNQGFWDQRLALEWTAKTIHVFGGDPDNVTVGGYSAGAHSAFQQLAHELFLLPAHQAVIKRVIMWSNSPGVQAKTLPEHQKQFDELLGVLRIPLSLSADDKLKRLRAVPAKKLIAALGKLKLSEFRALSDGVFVHRDIIGEINRGAFSRRMKSRGIKLLTGECRDEHWVYRDWRTPAASYEAVYARLCADYPEVAVRKLMRHYCGESRELPQSALWTNWTELFGHLYANMQVHCLQRGFVAALTRPPGGGGLEPGRDLLRYRLEWRTKGVDAMYPRAWGVTHGSDLAIWFWGHDIGGGIRDDEREILRRWNAIFAGFVAGEQLEWGGATKVTEMLRLTGTGETDVWVDDRWEEGLQVWKAVNGDTSSARFSWLRPRL